jgi:DUF917 family protein
LKYGRRLTSIGIPCNSFWRIEEALRVAGPKYFKYDPDYVPSNAVRIKVKAAGGLA